MSLVLIDGFEDRSSWTTPNAVVTGRNGSAAECTFGSNWDFTIPAALESATLVIGFAFKTSSLGAGNFLTLRSDAGATLHIALSLAADGSLQLLRGTTPLLTTANGVIGAIGTWYYVELSAKLSDTVGALILRVNGIVVASGNNIDTKNAGTKTVFDFVRFTRTLVVGQTNNMDDLYLLNGAADSFLGDVLVETLYPNGDGNANAWLGTDGNSVQNYLLVDDPPPTIDTTDYVAATTVGLQDMYQMTNLVRTTGVVLGVCHVAYALKSDTGTKSVFLVNRRSADNKSAALPLPTAFGSVHYCLSIDPETGAGFTITNVNALQSGIEVAV